MSGASGITRDLYQQYLRPDADTRQMLKTSRMSVLLISCLGLLVALSGSGIIPLYILAVKTVGAGLVFPFLALMFWRGATQKGVIASMVTGTGVSLFLHFAGYPYQAVAGYAVSLLSLIAVSLVTPHADDEQVRSVYLDGLDIDEYHKRFRNGEGDVRPD